MLHCCVHICSCCCCHVAFCLLLPCACCGHLAFHCHCLCELQGALQEGQLQWQVASLEQTANRLPADRPLEDRAVSLLYENCEALQLSGIATLKARLWYADLDWQCCETSPHRHAANAPGHLHANKSPRLICLAPCHQTVFKLLTCKLARNHWWSPFRSLRRCCCWRSQRQPGSCRG